MAANISGMALSTASKIIHEVCKAIAEHLGSKYITFTQNRGRNDPKSLRI